MAKVTRAVVTSSFAVAAVLGSLAFAAPAAAKNCPPGTTKTKFDGVCVAGGLGGNSVAPPVSAGGGSDVNYLPGQLPQVRGIPCTPEHYGTCYGLSQIPQ